MCECHITATLAGGTGKTVIAQMLAEANRRAGKNVLVVVADDKGRDDAGRLEIAELCPGIEASFLSAGPDSAAIEADPDALNRPWDPLNGVLDRAGPDGVVILDLGANVLQRLAAYVERMRVARRWAKAGHKITLWVPFNDDAANVTAALQSISIAEAAFPGASLVAVKNARDGAFATWDTSPFSAAFQAFEKKGGKIVDLPKCPAPAAGLAALKEKRIGFFSITDPDEDDVPALLGMTDKSAEPVALRTRYGIEDWIAAIYKAFRGLLPARA